MKIMLKKFRSKIEGEVLPMSEHRSLLLLDEHALRKVSGFGENTPSGCPCADDCQDGVERI